MVPENNEIIDEGKLYEKIINIFLEEGEEPNLKELMKNKSIIELMNALKNNNNKELARNALIVLLSLFDDYPPDLFSNMGTKLEDLSEEKRNEALDKLKEVFINKEE